MRHWLSISSLTVACLLFFSTSRLFADSPASLSTADLERQVVALTAIDDLDLTGEQMQSLKTIAADTAGDSPAAEEATKGSDEYHAALVGLRDALAKEDDDKIGDAQDKVDDLRDSLKIEPVAPVKISDSSRTKSRAAVRLLTSSQIANYIAAHADDVPDATETIYDALDQCKDGSESDFSALRDEAASQVSVLVAGMDEAAAKTVAQKVSDLLDKARKMKPAALNSRRGELDRDARQITRTTDSFDALHHWMAHEMAVFLSNPRLLSALDLRLASENQSN